MCGIAGMMTMDGRKPDEGVLAKLSQRLVHRGPDGQGRHAAGTVGLIQTRLAVIDLKTGDQPIYGGGDSGAPAAAIVANGEIYNYVELRAEMGEEIFVTRSDCEPPLHLYLRHGPDFTAKLRGMYAIAIHDIAAARLLLARDPFGIKPLYYAETADGFFFASEAQALIGAGVLSADINPRARDELLELQFSTGAETPFLGISRVLPGETLIVEHGRIVARRRRAALPDDGRAAANIDGGMVYALDAVLNDTIGVHQRSDVPYGMFFSGGIDSSVLLAMMARLNERPVKALTAGFDGVAVHDEREHARHVAKTVGAEHIEVDFSASDFWALLPAIAAAIDDAAADYAVLPTYKLAATAREHGLKVVLSGEGGDELFAGYGRYRHAARPWPFSRRMRRRGILEDMNILKDFPPGWRDGIARAEVAARKSGRTRLQAAQAADCADWLPNDLLTKLDRCLMAHGVEGRVPFLDPAMAEFAFPLADRLKVKHGLGKWVLRRWLETGLPAARPFARKRGFTVPVGTWIGERGGALGSLVARQPGIAELCRPGAVESLFSGLSAAGEGRRGKAAWTLLFYALWHEAHILGRSPQGGVFDSLERTP